MSELAGAALSYAERGWPTFPVEPRGKRPLGRLVAHGLKEASTDPDVVADWWRRAPAANVGLATGHRFDVLDIDTDEALDVLGRASRPDDAPTIDGPTCRTGGGGIHVYVAPTGGGNRAMLLGQKIDWRGLGGYVVAPPSVHSSGRRYEWEPGWSPADVPCAPLPGWAVELLGVGPRDVSRAETSAPAGRATSQDLGSTRPAGPEEGAYGRRALEAECGKVAIAAAGERNHTLNVAAFAIGQLVAGGEITDVAGAYDALLTAGLRAGLGEKETRDTLRSGLDKGSLQPRSAPRRAG